MSQLNLTKWLKLITIGVGISGLIIYFVIFPFVTNQWTYENTNNENSFWVWLIFLWVTGIPCFIALIKFWFICCEIGKDNSFSEKNAKLLKQISQLAIVNTGIFFIGNLIFACLDISNFEILIKSLLIDFAGISVAIASAALSHLVYKAAELKKENDLTI